MIQETIQKIKKKVKVKKVKAWAVVDKEREMPICGMIFGGENKDTIRYFNIYFWRHEALKRKSWINKPDQKDYKVVPITITYHL